MKAYSEDLRERIVGAVERGQHPNEVAQLFEVSIASVMRFVKQKRDRGHLRSQLPPRRPRTLNQEQEVALAEQVKVHSEASLEEHAKMLSEATGQRVGHMTVP